MLLFLDHIVADVKRNLNLEEKKVDFLQKF